MQVTSNHQQTGIKILYIGGYSRSGSTLLLRLISSMDHYVAVGELWDIWSRSFVDNQLCGCGLVFCKCDFWNAVMHEAFGGMDRVDVQHMITLRHTVMGYRYLPMLMIPALRTPSYRRSLREYAAIVEQIYVAITKVEPGKTIVDSSKVPTYVFLLNEMPSLDVSIIHLVRDSRATAYSWQRKKRRPEIHWKQSYMERYSPVRSALEWDVMNLLVIVSRRQRNRYVLCRYEDLVTSPGQALTALGRGIDEPMEGQIQLEADNRVRLRVDHTVSGNPNRFEQGSIKIVPDTEWHELMPKRHRTIVTALTYPLLRKYYYLKSGSR